jgi:hypothetical protein
MDKRMKIEGSGASRMIQLMRKHGYNKDISIDVATVISASPLSINIDGLQLSSDDLILSATVSQLSLQTGDTVIVISDEDAQSYFVIDKAVI